MIHNDSALQQFRPFAFEPSELRLKRTIRQLNGRKVIASYPDHHSALEECVAWAAEGNASITPRYVGDLSPWDGLRVFLQGGAEAYVGGVSQRLIAERFGAVALLTQEDLFGMKFETGKEIDLLEHNGLIVREERATELSSAVRAITDKLATIVQQIDEKHTMYVQGMIKELNRSSTRQRRNLPGQTRKKFGIGDFKRFWGQWIIMHMLPIQTGKPRPADAINVVGI